MTRPKGMGKDKSIDSPSPKVSEDETSPCRKCSKKIDNNSPAIQCNLCSAWFCLKCTNVSQSMYKAMKADDNDNCMYACQGCLGSLPTLKNISSDISDIKNSTMERFDNLEARVDSIEGQMKTTVAEEVNRLRTDIRAEILQELDKKNEERDEIAKRADNLIFYNVPESESDTAQVRINHDNEIIRKVCQTASVTEPVFSSIIRLGNRSKLASGKSRPVKVKFAQKSQRRTILTNSKLLSTSTNEIVKKVSVAKDLTIEQRKEYKTKLEAAKFEFESRTNKGEQDIERKGLRIVKKSSHQDDREPKSSF